MNREKMWTISVIIAMSSGVICLVSIFFSYRVYVSSKKLVTEYRDDLSTLHQSYAELEKQFTNIRKEQKLFKSQYAEKQFGHSLSKSTSPALGGKDKSGSDQQKKIEQLEKIINSTGLDQLAISGDLDPTILSKIYEDYALQDQMNIYREQILERNRELHQLDQKQYDEELAALYDRARLRRRGVGNAEDREKAFNEMLTNFPDAYATGMVIAERGLRSAMMRKGDNVQEYYDMLRKNDKFSNIVTDRGAEAIPNLENYLANSYIREGRVEEALVFIESLEGQYANSFVITRGADRRLRWVPAWQAAENLRNLTE